MDLKCDTFELDPALLLGYELEKLNLDSINDILSNDILEISKSEDNAEVENNVLSADIKVTEIVDSKCSENDGVASSATIAKSDAFVEKVETSSRITKRKKDINGNEEPLSDENLNDLFVKLELSDSDNEEADDEDSSKLKERGPIRPRPRRRANRIRDQNNVWGRNDGYDTSQFDSERLRFLSGSNQILSNEPIIPSDFSIHNNFTTIRNGNEPVYTLSNQDLFYEDARAHSVSSPESGYDSSAQSITGSPPPAASFFTSRSLDFIPETVDDQNIFEFLIENSDGALTDNLSLYNTDEKDEICEINKIVNFLKEDIPSELPEASNVITLSDNTVDHVPLVDYSEDLNTKSVSISQLPSSTVSKCVETPKKLVYKLKDEAKKALREFLSSEEFYEVKERIYKKISEDKKNKKKIKVICVEDEMDKASENRTNLHLAVLNNKIEDIYCLVEIHKQYNQPLADINIRDKNGKTALDYAIQNQMTLVIDYLKENTACQSVNI